MPSTLPELRAEVDQLNQDQRFEPLKKLLTAVNSLINARSAPDHVAALLGAIKDIQQQSEQGEDLRQAAERQIAKRLNQGVDQSNWTVDGDVIQPGRDANRAARDINQTVINFINRNLDNIEPTREIPPVRMDVVLLVMTRLEAEDLLTGKALLTDAAQGGQQTSPTYVLSEEMQQLCDLLPNRDKHAWIMRYGERPQDWKPAIEFEGRVQNVDGVPKADVTIDTIVTHILKDVAKNYESAIVPNYIDFGFLCSPSGRETLKKLRELGCVVIVDVISLRHPAIHRSYRRSWLDAFPKTVIARIAPDVNIRRLTQRITITLEEQMDFEFHNRRDESDALTSHVTDFENIRDLLKNNTGHLLKQARSKGVHEQTYQG